MTTQGKINSIEIICDDGSRAEINTLLGYPVVFTDKIDIKGIDYGVEFGVVTFVGKYNPTPSCKRLFRKLFRRYRAGGRRLRKKRLIKKHLKARGLWKEGAVKSLEASSAA